MQVAKIWIGNQPYLLEYRDKAYVVVSPLFKIIKSSDDKLFFDATSELVTHGFIKRVMPHTGRVLLHIIMVI